jgi:hypothetical protein
MGLGSLVVVVYCAARIFVDGIQGIDTLNAGFCGGATGWECVPCLDDSDVDDAAKLR